MGDAGGKEGLHFRLWLSRVGFTMTQALSLAVAAEGGWHGDPAGLHPPHGVCRGPTTSSSPCWRADGVGASKELHLPRASPGTT